MSSVCCVNCFNDNAIKRVIISLSQLGRCHYCNQNNAPINQLIAFSVIDPKEDDLPIDIKPETIVANKYQLKSKHVFITKTL